MAQGYGSKLHHWSVPHVHTSRAFSPSKWGPDPQCKAVDLMVTMSCGLTLQTYLIIALSFHSRHWRFGFVNGQVSLAWSFALRTKELYTQPPVLKERWREERTGSSSLNFFQAVFTPVMIESSQHLSWVAKGSYHLQLVRSNFPLWSAVQGVSSSLAPCTSVIYEGESIKNQPNLFLDEIDLFFFDVFAL